MSSPRILTGCDLQDVGAVAAAVASFGERYLHRVYTADELAAVRPDDMPALAARFAAKEAVIKLVGLADGVDLLSIEVTNTVNGRPTVALSGPVAQAAAAQGIDAVDLSLSHTSEFAMATAVALADTTGEESAQ